MLHDSRPGAEVCGASLRGRVEIVRGSDASALVQLVHLRYVTPVGLELPEVREFLAFDDVALVFRPDAAWTWDERDNPAAARLRASGKRCRSSPRARAGRIRDDAPVRREGTVAAITGAGSGIGRGIAAALAASGARVVANDLDSSGLDETLELVRTSGSEGVASVGDVRRREDVQRIVDDAISAFGGLDVMVANAAVGIYADLEEMCEEDLDRVIDVNLKGALLSAQLAIPALRERGGGSIVFVTSVQAYATLRGCVAYGATKAALVAATRALAVELGADGIRVNAVAPGTIDTPMLARDVDAMNAAGAEGFLDRVRGANALGRIGTVDEIGDVVAFLVSDAARYVTGATIVADGGFLAVKSF